MKWTRITAIISLLFFSIAGIYSNDKVTIYNAYVNNDMSAWKIVIDRIQKQENKNNETILSLINYQYGYIGWCIGMKKDSEAEYYISLADDNIALLEKSNYALSKIYAYKAALYGYEIGLNIIKAPFIGPKSIKYAENALKLDQKNPLAYIQLGNIQFYMPSMFGGSAYEAIQYFLKARVLMEANPDAVRQDWNYLHLLTLLVQAYTDVKDYKSAKAYCELILKIEPKFVWIKDELYPQVMKQFKN